VRPIDCVESVIQVHVAGPPFFSWGSIYTPWGSISFSRKRNRGRDCLMVLNFHHLVYLASLKPSPFSCLLL